MDFDKLAKLIGNVLNLPPEKIKPESSFRADLNADSLDLFQIVIALEEEYQIEINPDEAEKVRTVGDVAQAISRQKRSLPLGGKETL